MAYLINNLFFIYVNRFWLNIFIIINRQIYIIASLVQAKILLFFND